MIRAIDLYLLCAVSLSPAMGFGPAPFRTSRRTSPVQRKISWSEYEHEFVDPLTHHGVEGEVEDRTDAAKRAVADRYWAMQFREGKERLHRINEADDRTVDEESPIDSWTQYEHEFVDPITPHEAKSELEGHMDPEKRAKADEFWLQKFRDDKEKLHRGEKLH